MIPVLLATLAHAEVPVSVNLSAGGGLPYGLGGAVIEADLLTPKGAGVSAHVGAGAAVTAGAHLWLPGQKLRFGVGASTSALWEDIGYQSADCGMVLVPEGTAPPEPVWAIRPSLFAADVIVDHDIGQPGGLSLRYGLGAGIVVAGCVGGILPLPTLGLSYRF